MTRPPDQRRDGRLSHRSHLYRPSRQARPSRRARPAGLTAALLVTALSACSSPSPGPARPTATATLTPATTSAVGHLVGNFPVSVIPVPPGATVTGSAASAEPAGLMVSLTGTSPAPVAALLRFYRGTLTAAGFTASTGAVLPKGAQGAVYSRSGGDEMLLLAIVDRGPLRSFSIGGTLSAAAAASMPPTAVAATGPSLPPTAIPATGTAAGATNPPATTTSGSRKR